MNLQSTQGVLMVLSGSFLLAGWGDGEGGRESGAGEEDGFHPRCAGVHASSPTPQLVPAGPWSLGLAAATQDQGTGTTVQSCQASRVAGQVTCFCT